MDTQNKPNTLTFASPTDFDMDSLSDTTAALQAPGPELGNNKDSASPTGPIKQATKDSTVVTLEPFETNMTWRRRGGGAQHRQKRRDRPFELIQRNLTNNTLTSSEYKVFYVIKSKSGENLAEINVVQANKEIIHALNGKPRRISEQRD